MHALAHLYASSQIVVFKGCAGRLTCRTVVEAVGAPVGAIAASGCVGLGSGGRRAD